MNDELAKLYERASLALAAVAAYHRGGLADAAPAVNRARPLTPEGWRAYPAWPPPPELIDLNDTEVWAVPKAAAQLLNLSPTGGAIYDRINRRPISVKFGGRVYVNIARARTPAGTLPGEMK